MADDRMRWKGRFEFVFASFGNTIGLGNLWRFPQKCYSNGGGVFLIPYILCVILCTIPTLFLEFGLGQIKSEGFIKVWKFAPLIQGVGVAIWFNLMMTVIYYNVILMYALYYMLVSFLNIGSDLPWSTCRPEDWWTTDKCLSPNIYDSNSRTADEIKQTKLQFMNSTCVSNVESKTDLSTNDISVEQLESIFAGCKVAFVTPEEEFWTRLVLGVHESDGFDDMGAIRARNAMMLFTMWLIVYYCCVRGIRSIAKFILIASAIGYTKSSYDGVELTPGGEAIGWLLIITPFLIMVGFGGYQVWRRGGVRAALGPYDYTVPDTNRSDTDHSRRQGDGTSNGYISPIHDTSLSIPTTTGSETRSSSSDTNIDNPGFELDGDDNNGLDIAIDPLPPVPCVKSENESVT